MRIIRLARIHDDQLLATDVPEEIVAREMAFALRGVTIAVCQKPRQPSIGVAVARIGENVGRAVAKDETRAGDDAKVAGLFPVVAQEEVRAHNSCKRIAIGDADAGKLQRNRSGDELFRMRGTAQEGKIRRNGELGIAR